MTIATTGGTFLFYLLGVMIAISLSRVAVLSAMSKRIKKTTGCMGYIYVTLSLAFLINTAIELLPRLRSDIFLISNLQGAYQRPGNFLALSFLLFSVVFMLIVLLNKDERVAGYRRAAPFLLLAYLFQACVSILFSQMIGSNKALALIGGFTFVTLSFYFLLFFPRVRRLLCNAPLNLKHFVLGTIGRKLVAGTALSLVFLVVVLWGAIIYFEVDISSSRIMNFGRGGMTTSLSSRIDILLGKFPVQFDYAPFFGNMNVDTLTTGRGSYAHSFLGMSLTHLGVFGTMIFLVYLALAFKSFFIQPLNNISTQSAFVAKSSSLYAAFMFCAIFLLAVVSSGLTWIVFWFAMGFFTCPIAIRGKQKI
jgi:hypothetical protein